MSMTKYGATPAQTSKTAEGNPGRFSPKTFPQVDREARVESLKEKIAREKREKAP